MIHHCCICWFWIWCLFLKHHWIYHGALCLVSLSEEENVSWWVEPERRKNSYLKSGESVGLLPHVLHSTPIHLFWMRWDRNQLLREVSVYLASRGNILGRHISASVKNDWKAKTHTCASLLTCCTGGKDWVLSCSVFFTAHILYFIPFYFHVNTALLYFILYLTIYIFFTLL